MSALVLPVELAAVLALLCLLGALGIIARRFWLFRHPGVFDCSLRIPGRGWRIGVAEYAYHELRWYAFFSLRLGPSRVFRRRDLTAVAPTAPGRRGQLDRVPGVSVVRCEYHDRAVDFGMSPATATGFSSWLESAPPGPGGMSY